MNGTNLFSRFRYVFIVIIITLQIAYVRLEKRKMFYEDILNDLSVWQIEGNPAKLTIKPTVFARTEAVFAGKTADNIILAAAEYGQGRVFVSGHDSYLYWITKRPDELRNRIIDNVLNWLCKGENVVNSDIYHLKTEDLVDFSKYKLVIWNGLHYNINKNVQYKLLQYLKNGGALFAAFTAWTMNNNKLSKNSMNTFLSDNMGIGFTIKPLSFNFTTPVDQNYANFSSIKRSEFDESKSIGKSIELKSFIPVFDSHFTKLKGKIGFKAIQRLNDSLNALIDKKELFPSEFQSSFIDESAKKLLKILSNV